jgi:nucleotide-binding universal stress UspA family protein
METLKNVLVGVDPSPESARAAAMGCRFAEVAGGSCHLLHVADDLLVGVTMFGPPPTLQRLELRQRREDLQKMLRNTLSAGVLQHLEITLGSPARVLEERAAEADLLVLGGKHHTVLERWLSGSTVHQVVRSLRTPLLVAGPSGDTPYRILAAVDLSSAATEVLAEARRVARLFRSELAVLHVVEPPPVYGALSPIGIPLGEMVTQADWNGAAEKAFDQQVWPQVDYARAERILRFGAAGETIRAEVERWHPDLVVVGSHGRGWTEWLLLGSTTHDLLNDLRTSLLVVPVGKPVTRVLHPVELPALERQWEVL